MLYKFIITLILSLAVTAGVSSLIAIACGGGSADKAAVPSEVIVKTAQPRQRPNTSPKPRPSKSAMFNQTSSGSGRVFVSKQEGRVPSFENNPFTNEDSSKVAEIGGYELYNP